MRSTLPLAAVALSACAHALPLEPRDLARVAAAGASGDPIEVHAEGGGPLLVYPGDELRLAVRTAGPVLVHVGELRFDGPAFAAPGAPLFSPDDVLACELRRPDRVGTALLSTAIAAPVAWALVYVGLRYGWLHLAPAHIAPIAPAHP